MHMDSAQSNNLTSFACVAQRLIGTSFKDPPSSEEFKSRWISSKGSRKLGIWSEGWEIKMSFLLYFIMALNLHNKSLPKRFAGEELDTKES